MGKDFKKQAEQMRDDHDRKAVPQVDPEKALTQVPPAVASASVEPTKPKPDEPAPAFVRTGPTITTVDTSERATNVSFSMYPSRHEQVVRDLAYVERRRPWEIIEEALEEYVVKHYGKEHKRQ